MISNCSESIARGVKFKDHRGDRAHPHVLSGVVCTAAPAPEIPMMKLDMPPDTPLLFTPIKLRSWSPAIESSRRRCARTNSDDGGPGEWQLVDFGRFAMSGTWHRLRGRNRCGAARTQDASCVKACTRIQSCSPLRGGSKSLHSSGLEQCLDPAGPLRPTRLGGMNRLKGRANYREDARSAIFTWWGPSLAPAPSRRARCTVPRPMYSHIKQNFAAW